MDDDEDVLEIGPRRRPRPVLTRVLTVLVIVCAVGGYYLVHRGGKDSPKSAPSPARTFALPSGPDLSTASPLPPWPKADGACGNDAFVPIVSARPLRESTGVRLLVGDRLSTVDLDAGSVQPRTGLANGVYASEIAATGAGTFAALIKCQPDTVITSTIVRLDDDGGLQPVATGTYSQLLGGGDHPWGVIYRNDGSTSVDPLDGGRAVTLPADFVPAAGFGRYLIGSAIVLSHSSSDGPQAVQVWDPVTGRAVRTFGSASSMAVSRGVVLWADYRCPREQCELHAIDLASGRTVPISATVPSGSGLWSAVLSPDRSSLAYVRQRSTPSQYEMGHPGNPNEVVTVDLHSGQLAVVPGLQIWSKSTPGLDYSADSRWLVMSLDAGTRVRLLLWHPGQTHPLEPSVRLTGSVAFAPLVTALA